MTKVYKLKFSAHSVQFIHSSLSICCSVWTVRDTYFKSFLLFIIIINLLSRTHARVLVWALQTIHRLFVFAQSKGCLLYTSRCV